MKPADVLSFLWRKKGTVCRFLAWSGLILFTCGLMYSSMSGRGAPDTAPQTWGHRTVEFYNACLPLVSREVQRLGAPRIQIHPEKNTTDYSCASPCNAGFADAVFRSLNPSGSSRETESSSAKEVLFWDQPVSLGTLGRRLANPDSGVSDNALFRATGMTCGWRRAGRDPPTGYIPPPDDSTPTLHLTLEISDLQVDRDKQRFSTRLVLLGGPSPSQQANLGTFPYEGSLRQIRWFTRRKCPDLFGVLSYGWIYFGVLIAILVLWLRPVQRFLDTYDEAIVAVRWLMIAPLLALIMLYWAPVMRGQALFYQQANLFYVVDTNSETWFESPSDQEGKQGVPDLASALEKSLHESPILNPAGPEKRPFWRWLASGTGLRAVYDPEEYRLNQPFLMNIYGYSGCTDEDWDWFQLGPLKGDTIWNARQPGGRMSVDLRREARLLNPRDELQEILEQATDQSDQDPLPSYVLLLTSQCASSARDVRTFLDTQARVDETMRDQTQVMTVLLPTLPRTGASRFYDYEDGKYGLACLPADWIAVLNEPGQNGIAQSADSPRSRQLEEFRTQLLAQLPPELQGRGPSNRVFLDPATYSIPDLSSQDREKWELPRDLDRERTSDRYGLLVETTSVQQTCEQLVPAFHKFIETAPRKPTVFVIHVIGRHPWLWGLLTLLLTLPFGALAFYGQYDSPPYRWRLALVATARWFHWLTALVSLLVMLAYFFAIVWQSEDPQVWTACGDPSWALCVVLLCWACWVAPPHVYLRLIEWRDEPKGAGWWTCVVALVFVIYLVLMHSFFPQHYGSWQLLKLIAVLIPGGVTIGVAGYFVHHWEWEQYDAGAGRQTLPWWRDPQWSTWVTCIMAICLVTLTRGALLATPEAAGGWLAPVSALMSRLGFVGSVSLTVTIVSVIAFGIALTQPNRVSWNRAVFWVLPLFTAFLSLVLLYTHVS